MRLGFSDRGRDSWAVLRRRMIRETELFIERGLSRPHLFQVIPAMRSGSGRFPRGLADLFWSQVLASS